MKKVMLRMNELEKYNKIKELVDHNGNKKRVALKLGLSIRQVNRLIKKYITRKVNLGFVHGNHCRMLAKTLDKSISDNIL